MLNALTRRWYLPAPAPWYLRPLSALFGCVARVRRNRQRAYAERHRLPVPVIVVGNIAVGGTGKTPFVIWLVARLREAGWKPGVVSRGYGGRARDWPRPVSAQSDAAEVGDEPVLIASRAACPVVVGPDRVAAARRLLERGDVDVVVSDDGLQHYRLWRNREIAVVDASRGLGNGSLLPAGPLREPAARLAEVDCVVINGAGWAAPVGRQARMRLGARHAYALHGGETRPISAFAGTTVHAVAGIGNPARFFSLLSQHGIRLIVHPFPDHHAFAPHDLAFDDGLPVLMTEKDAVKCRRFAGAERWVVPVEASIDAAGLGLVQELIDSLPRKTA